MILRTESSKQAGRCSAQTEHSGAGGHETKQSSTGTDPPQEKHLGIGGSNSIDR